MERLEDFFFWRQNAHTFNDPRVRDEPDAAVGTRFFLRLGHPVRCIEQSRSRNAGTSARARGHAPNGATWGAEPGMIGARGGRLRLFRAFFLENVFESLRVTGIELGRSRSSRRGGGGRLEVRMISSRCDVITI